MVYLSSDVSALKSAAPNRVPVQRVENRAGAVEVLKCDAVVLQQRAQKLWPDSYWEIERTYSGKYVVRTLDALS
jgi:hypothetical protein